MARPFRFSPSIDSENVLAPLRSEAPTFPRPFEPPTYQNAPPVPELPELPDDPELPSPPELLPPQPASTAKDTRKGTEAEASERALIIQRMCRRRREAASSRWTMPVSLIG